MLNNRHSFLPNHKYYYHEGWVIPDSDGSPLRYWAFSAGENVGDYDEATGKYIIPIRVSGKNLFNYAAVDNDKLINCVRGHFSRSVTTITTHQNACTIFIPCKPNTTYTISRSIENSNLHFGYTAKLPEVGVIVYEAKSVNSKTDKTLTIKTGEDAKYLVAYIYNGFAEPGKLPEILQSIQIEEGATNTEHEAFKSKMHNIYLDAPISDNVIDSWLDDMPTIETFKGYNNIMVLTNGPTELFSCEYYK